MATDRALAFREYKENIKEKEEKKQEIFEKNKDRTLSEVINHWYDYKLNVQKHDLDTADNQRRKLRQIFKDLEININTTTLGKFIEQHGGPKKITKLLEEYKKFYIARLNDKNIPDSEKLQYNAIASLITPVNPFFEHYLGLKIHVKTLGKKQISKTLVRLDDINKLLRHINDFWGLKIKLADSEEKKIEYRKRWALERIVVNCSKFLWVRGKEITEDRLSLADIKEMKRSGKLPLHTRKRTNNPKEFQQPVVVNDFLIEWEMYEPYRDSSDTSDSAPAIVQVNSHGQAIKRRWIRKVFQRRRQEAGLPEYLTQHRVRASMHTLCKTMINNQKIAQIQLGDVSSKIADDHYNIPDTELIRQELERFYKCDRIPGDKKTPMEDESTSDAQGDMAYT